MLLESHSFAVIIRQPTIHQEEVDNGLNKDSWILKSDAPSARPRTMPVRRLRRNHPRMAGFSDRLALFLTHLILTAFLLMH